MTTVATYSTIKPVTDWQGNNAAVVSSSGSVEQQTIYYPYGEPTIEPASATTSEARNASTPAAATPMTSAPAPSPPTAAGVS